MPDALEVARRTYVGLGVDIHASDNASARYAGAFAREKSSLDGWGPVKIRYALRMKGIADAAIGEALDGVDTDKAEARLSKLIEAKRKSLEGDPQIRLKLIKFALSRGYEYDTVERYI